MIWPTLASESGSRALIKNLGLTNNLVGIILPQIAFALPATVIILVPFLAAIPKELEEAAAIDGAGRISFFFRMVLPLSLPGVITTGFLAFIGAWNGYLLPLFILNNAAQYTLPLGVQAFSSEHSVDTAAVLAFTSLSMIPALLFFSILSARRCTLSAFTRGWHPFSTSSGTPAGVGSTSASARTRTSSAP